MGFWTHSFASRRQRDYDVIEQPQRDFATVSLAGWRFEQHRDGSGDWNTYAPDGDYHGINASREGAVRYAIGFMDGTIHMPPHVETKEERAWRNTRNSMAVR